MLLTLISTYMQNIIWILLVRNLFFAANVFKYTVRYAVRLPKIGNFRVASGVDIRAKCFNASAEIEVSIKVCGFFAGQTLFGKIYWIFVIMTNGLTSRDRSASGCSFTPQSQLDPFHCDHIARWSARSGTTGRSGTGVNMGARLRFGTIPVPKP